MLSFDRGQLAPILRRGYHRQYAASRNARVAQAEFFLLILFMNFASLRKALRAAKA